MELHIQQIPGPGVQLRGPALLVQDLGLVQDTALDGDQRFGNRDPELGLLGV